MHSYSHRSCDPGLRHRLAQQGFTLIEVMIVVAIVAILAAIALPSYADYVKRGKIIEATSGLSDLRQGMEQYFLDNRDYRGYCASSAGTARVQPGIKAFNLTCAETQTTYTITATGLASEGMDLFIYTIDESGQKKTTSAPPGWGSSFPVNCWVIRKGGGCT